MSHFDTSNSPHVDLSQPWQIIAAFPGHQPRVVGQTHNRSDAEDMARFLQRKVPNGSFYVAFNPNETIDSEPGIQY